jgi:alpha-L-rhamnosidase
MITANWRIDDGELTLDTVVPAGTSAEVRLPGRAGAVVGPGTHTFSVPYGPAGLAVPAGPASLPHLTRSAP